MTEGPPLVSIVTPVFNAAESIGRTLASVSAQTHPRVEHIVVDGGSSDATMQIVSAFRSRHELRWVSEPDQGMYPAINKGLRLARGDVLAYLNADDLYLPWAAELASAALGGGCELVYGDLGVLAADGRSAFRPQVYRAFDLNHYTHFEAIGQPTVFWTRSLGTRIGEFDPRWRLIADCDYWIRAGLAGARICHLDEILALQLDHPGTLRARQRDLLREEFAELRRHYASAVGPPRRPAVHAVAARLRSRWDRMRFAAAMAGRPMRWPRFAAFLREHDVHVSPGGLAWFVLPGRMRPPSASLVDAVALERALRAALREPARD